MIKDYLKEKVQNLYEEGYEFYDLPYELFGENVKNWPEVPDSDEPEILETLDMENFEFLSINEDAITIACGGDWQEPKTLTIELVDGELTVTNVEDDEYADGMDEDEFLDAIGVENPYKDEDDETEEEDEDDY